VEENAAVAMFVDAVCPCGFRSARACASSI